MSEFIFNALRLTEQEQQAFREAAPNIEQCFFPLMPDSCLIAPQPVPSQLAQATVILGCPPVPDVAALKHLKWLQAWSAGVDAYLAPGCLPEGAMLTTSVGAYGPSVAEHTFAMALTLMKQLPQYQDQQRARLWQDRGTVQTFHGAQVLVVGAGDIGGCFASMCHAMGSHTIGLKRSVCAPPPGFDEIASIAQLDALLPQADVVALFLPHTPETHHLLDARRLGLMKKGAILVNGGRGPLVDPDALLEALGTGALGGAGLDVTEPEPLPSDSPLWAQENLLITPHVAGGLHNPGTRERIVAIALENLKHYLAGESLRNRTR